METHVITPDEAETILDSVLDAQAELAQLRVMVHRLAEENATLRAMLAAALESAPHVEASHA